MLPPRRNRNNKKDATKKEHIVRSNRRLIHIRSIQGGGRNININETDEEARELNIYGLHFVDKFGLQESEKDALLFIVTV